MRSRGTTKLMRHAGDDRVTGMRGRELTLTEGIQRLLGLETILAVTEFEKRLNAFERKRERWVTRPYSVWSDPEVHPLVPGLWRFRQWKLAGFTQTPLARLDPEVLAVIEHANYIHLALLDLDVGERRQAETYLSQRLDTDDPGPILFEVRTTASLRFRGHRARWLSPFNEDSHDIDVNSGIGEVAVECKCQRLGAGRKVPTVLFRRLAGEIDRVDDVACYEYAIVIEPLERLEAADVASLVSFLKPVLRKGEETHTEIALNKGRYAVQARRLVPKGNHVRSSEAWRMFAALRPSTEGALHVAAKSTMWLSSRSSGDPVNPGFLLCQSRQRDRILPDLMRLAEDAADRLTPDRPGIVVVHVAEHVDWRALSEGLAAIDFAVTKTFSGDSKRHVSLVVFSSEAQDWPFGPRYAGALPAKAYQNPYSLTPIATDVVLGA